MDMRLETVTAVEYGRDAAGRRRLLVEIVEKARDVELPQILDYLEGRMPANGFLFGELSIADLSLAPAFANARAGLLLEKYLLLLACAVAATAWSSARTCARCPCATGRSTAVFPAV